MPSTANRVIKNTGFLYAKMGITMFISLYTTRLILNALGAEDFGVFNIVGGAIAMLGFLNAAMAGATQRFMSYSEGEGNLEKQKKIFNISFVLHLGISVLMGIVLLIAGYFFFNGILNIAPERMYAAKVVYASLIVSTIFTVMTVPYDAVLNAHENMFYYSIVGIVESLLKLAVALAVVYVAGDKLVLYGILMAIIPLITITIMRVYCHRKYSECLIAPKQYWNKHLMKEMTGFAGWSFLGSSTSMLGNYGLGILLNHFFGTLLNAAQGVAGQLNGLLYVFSSTMMKALNPIIVKNEGSGDRAAMIESSLIGCKYSFYLFSFFAIPFLIETPQILKLWIVIVPDWTVVFCKLAIIRTLIELLTLTLNTSLGAQGKIKKLSITKSFLNLLPLPIIYLAFKFGYPPTSMYFISILIWGLLEGTVNIYFMRKNCGLKISDFNNKVLFKILLVFLIVYSVSTIPSFFYFNSIYRLFFTFFLSSITFCITVIFIGMNNYEKTVFRNSLNLFAKKYLNKK